MTIVAYRLQKCDRCKDERELKKTDQPDLNGWREIKTNKHLCPNCIHVILEEGKVTPEELVRLYATQSIYLEQVWVKTAIRPQLMHRISDVGVAPVIDNVILTWDEFVSLTQELFK